MELKARFTAHTFGGYWWICDNLTNKPVTNKAGRRLFYHINCYGMEKAAAMVKAKVNRLNAEVKGE